MGPASGLSRERPSALPAWQKIGRDVRFRRAGGRPWSVPGRAGRTPSRRDRAAARAGGRFARAAAHL